MPCRACIFTTTTSSRYAASLKPSARGELEITDLNRIYLEEGKLRVSVMGRGVAWLDAGTHESLLQAANFVQAVEDRQGMMISCPEEIAYRMGYIDKDQIAHLGKKYVQQRVWQLPAAPAG